MIFIMCAAISAVSLVHHFTWGKLTALTAASIIIHVVLQWHGKSVARQIAADKLATLQAIAHRMELERRLEAIKRKK